MADKFTRLSRTLPGFYRAESNTLIRGLLKAWAISDDEIEVQIKEAKNQLFVATSDSTFLDRNASNYGVDRSSDLGVDDSDFRELVPILSTFPKQVRQTIIALFEVFWGAGFTRANINSGNFETFNFGSPNVLSGTFFFKQGQKLVKGTGTNFLAELTPGDFIRPDSSTDKQFARVSRIISNEELELSLEWPHASIALIGGVVKEAMTLTYIVDSQEERIMRIPPNAFVDITTSTAQELADFINGDPEHQDHIEASVFLDPLSGNKLNLRTHTPGLQGSIQITGGTANVPSMLNFSLDEQTEVRAAVYEVNTNEIVVQIPSTVPLLRNTLAGSVHPKDNKEIITSVNEPYNFSTLGTTSTLDVEVEGTPYTVLFTHSEFENPTRVSAAEVTRVINQQLTFLEAFTKEVEAFKNVGLRTTEGSAEYQVIGGPANGLLQFPTDLQQDPDLIQTDYPSSYVFDPTGQLFTVTGNNAKLITSIGQGAVQPTISVDNAANFPNSPGLLLFNFGRSEQEGPIAYSSRPNNSTLLIDASHIFQRGHDVDRFVNLVSDQPTIPRVTGDDYPVYITGTQQARAAAQDLIRRLIAAGVVIRFIIDFPEVLFECKVHTSTDPDYAGSLTGGTPLFIC